MTNDTQHRMRFAFSRLGCPLCGRSFPDPAAIRLRRHLQVNHGHSEGEARQRADDTLRRQHELGRHARRRAV